MMATCNEPGVNKEEQGFTKILNDEIKLEAIAEDTEETPVVQLHVSEGYEQSHLSTFATQSKTNWSEDKEKVFGTLKPKGKLGGEQRTDSAESEDTNDMEEDLEDNGNTEEVLIKSENPDEFEFKLEFVEENNSLDDFVMGQNVSQVLEQKYQPISSSPCTRSSIQPQTDLWILPHDTKDLEAPPDDCDSGIKTNENNKIRSSSLSEETHMDGTLGNFTLTHNTLNNKRKFEISSISTSVVLKSKKISRKKKTQFESACTPENISHATDKTNKTHGFSCDKNFTSKCSLQSHTQRIHDRITRYECYFCPKRFFGLTQLFTHIRCHTKEQPFTCCICGSRFSMGGSLNNHIKNIHEGIKPLKSLKCTFKDCEYRCAKNRDIIVHTRTHTGERPFKCDICESNFKTNRTRNEHIKRVHVKNKPFKCTYNGCVYRSSDQWCLRMHIRVHTRENPYQCEICKKLFVRRSSLTRHKKTANCQQAQLIGANQTQKKQFSCKICGGTFAEKPNLIKHTRIFHDRVTNLKYECYFCSRRFFSLAYLCTHIRRHTKEQPFTCCICGLKFTHRSSLNSHSSTFHTEFKRFKCTFKDCEQRFFLEIDLTRHIKNHAPTKKKKIKCTLCGLIVTRSSSLYRHIRKVHKGEGLRAR